MMTTLSDFLYMGGYAFYVWGSFLMCALFCVIEPVGLARTRRRVLRDLHRAADARGALESEARP